MLFCVVLCLYQLSGMLWCSVMGWVWVVFRRAVLCYVASYCSAVLVNTTFPGGLAYWTQQHAPAT